MAHLFTALTSAKIFDPHIAHIEDDFIDRLHYQATSMTLLAFAIGVSFKQFGGRPMECALSQIAEGSDEEYVENYCWAQSTYFVPWKGDIPVDYTTRRHKELSYYQWVPFFLIIQALCFQIPYLFWKSMATHSGIRAHMLVREAISEKNLDLEVRRQTISTLRKHIENALRFHKRIYRRHMVPHKILRFMNLPYSSCYITVMYLLTKSMYLANVVGQFRLLNWFMLPTQATEYTAFYGYSALLSLMNGTDWGESGMFPRVTICDFDMRKLGDVQRYSVQCVLVINMFNEKIFVFMWMWYALLNILTAVSFVYWTIITILPCFRRVFVVRHLELADMPFDCKESTADIDTFTFNHLHCDGVFVIRMITNHAGVMMGTDLTAALWRSYFELDGVEPKLIGTVQQAIQKLKVNNHHNHSNNIKSPPHIIAPPRSPRQSQHWPLVMRSLDDKRFDQDDTESRAKLKSADEQLRQAQEQKWTRVNDYFKRQAARGGRIDTIQATQSGESELMPMLVDEQNAQTANVKQRSATAPKQLMIDMDALRTMDSSDEDNTHDTHRTWLDQPDGKKNE